MVRERRDDQAARDEDEERRDEERQVSPDAHREGC